MRPKSVAVIGASAKRTAAGNELLANLARFGFTGDVHVVHPTADAIDGLPPSPPSTSSRAVSTSPSPRCPRPAWCPR